MKIKVLIIVTSPYEKSDRFIPDCEWCNAWRFNDKNTFAYRVNQDGIKFCDRVADIPLEKFPIIIWVNTKKARVDKLGDILGQLWKALRSKVNVSEVRIAYHDVKKVSIPVELQEVAALYSLSPGNESQFTEIIEEGRDKKKYLDANADFNKILDCFFLNLPKAFSLLKHRIAQLFLPLEVDLVGIAEVKGKQTEDRKDAQVAYLSDVLKKKGETYYRQKLANLQYMVAGNYVDFSGANGTLVCEDDGFKNCKPVEPEKNEKNRNQSMYDIVSEKNREWERLITLCGLKEKGNGPGENTIFEPDTGSPIFRFMCLLDCMAKKEKATREDVENVLDYFASFHDWFASFHDWFCALADEMRKLESQIKSESSGS